jgi:hypothetical protein
MYVLTCIGEACNNINNSRAMTVDAVQQGPTFQHVYFNKLPDIKTANNVKN